MVSTSTSGNDLISITVQVSAMGGSKKVELNDTPLSTAVGELRTKLNVRPNSRFGRLHKYDNWDNRRSLSDYFVKNGEQLSCTIQCRIEEGQPDFDDYEQWLSANKNH